jgi:hypothetical protein
MTPEERKAELELAGTSTELNQLGEDIRAEVRRYLPKFGARREQLLANSPDQLLMIYMNWRSRLIHPHPRAVHISSEISARRKSNDPLFAQFHKEIDELINMIETGKDLTDLLSSRLEQKPYELEPDFEKLKDEKHIDLLLNEQGIHHLHLPGLQSRENTPILFCIFELESAFLLDIARHDDWSTDRLARISYGNWGQRHFAETKIDRLCVNSGTSIELEDWQRVNVRNAGVNTPIQIEKGLFVFPRMGGGLTANGFSGSIVTRCNAIWNSLILFEIRRRRPAFVEYFRQRTGKALPENPEFHFHFIDTGREWSYAIVEEKTLGGFLLPDYFGVAGMRNSPGAPCAG